MPRWEAGIDYREWIYCRQRCEVWSPSQLGVWLIVAEVDGKVAQLGRLYHSLKHRQEEEWKGKRRKGSRVIHMEASSLPSTAILSFHIHSACISSWAIQVVLPFAGGGEFKGALPACRFLKIPVKLLCSGFKVSKAAHTSKTLLWLCLYQQPVLQPAEPLVLP